MRFNDSFKIDDKFVGLNHPVYIVAEMSTNHGKDFGKAVEIVHAAKESGADAIKLQTYTADTLTLNCQSDFFYIKKGPWKGQYLHDLYKDISMPLEWHGKLKEVADSIGITLFSTPFDLTSIDLLEDLDMPAYKIASPELIELPLIRRAAKTKKPLIMSTGNATLAEINEAVRTVADEGAKDICLLKCTSTYPAPPEDINLKTIPNMISTFSCPIGLSDHSLGIGASIASVSFGVCMVERHFLLDKNDETADSFFSLTPGEFSTLVQGIRVAEKAIGQVEYPLYSNPQRSLIAVEDISKNEILSYKNVYSLRPGGGIEPKYMEIINGRIAMYDIKRGTPIEWTMVGSPQTEK